MRRLCLALLALTASVPIAAHSNSVTVISGDTLSEIAERYDISLNELLKINDIKNSTILQIGQRIKVPGLSKVTLKYGETLSEIAVRYDVPMSKIQKINKISDPDFLPVGIHLKIPGLPLASKTLHTVKRNESLSTIASLYNIKTRDLMALNKLKDENFIQTGEVLRLPNYITPRSNNFNSSYTPSIKNIPEAKTHILQSGETLSQIARTYSIPLYTLLKINKIKSPDKISSGTLINLEPSKMDEVKTSVLKVNTTVAINSIEESFNEINDRENLSESSTEPIVESKNSWRTYGPLKVNWSKWQDFEGSKVAPTLSPDGEPIYLAVNCSARKINATGDDGNWKKWFSPKTKFEKNLFNDRCLKDKET